MDKKRTEYLFMQYFEAFMKPEYVVMVLEI